MKVYQQSLKSHLYIKWLASMELRQGYYFSLHLIHMLWDMNEISIHGTLIPLICVTEKYIKKSFHHHYYSNKNTFSYTHTPFDTLAQI